MEKVLFRWRRFWLQLQASPADFASLEAKLAAEKRPGAIIPLSGGEMAALRLRSMVEPT